MASAIRRLPRYQIVSRLKARHIRQADIAKRARASQGYVSQVLARHYLGPLAERVWTAIEKALA